MKQTDSDTSAAIDELMKCEFLGDRDPEFWAFIERMPDTHWAKYDISAVRLGWEAYKKLHKPDDNLLPEDAIRRQQHEATCKKFGIPTTLIDMDNGCKQITFESTQED